MQFHLHLERVNTLSSTNNDCLCVLKRTMLYNDHFTKEIVETLFTIHICNPAVDVLYDQTKVRTDKIFHRLCMLVNVLTNIREY
jgi:hypothetical protein